MLTAMTCPSTSPDGAAACILDDTLDVHEHGHRAPTVDGLGIMAWGVSIDDHTRWATTPPDELVSWAQDAADAAQADTAEPPAEAEPESV